MRVEESSSPQLTQPTTYDLLQKQNTEVDSALDYELDSVSPRNRKRREFFFLTHQVTGRGRGSQVRQANLEKAAERFLTALESEASKRAFVIITLIIVGFLLMFFMFMFVCLFCFVLFYFVLSCCDLSFFVFFFVCFFCFVLFLYSVISE